jgi:hypothetical protein
MSEEFMFQDGDYVDFQGKRWQCIQTDKLSKFLTLEELPSGEIREQVPAKDVQAVMYPFHEEN